VSAQQQYPLFKPLSISSKTNATMPYVPVAPGRCQRTYLTNTGIKETFAISLTGGKAFVSPAASLPPNNYSVKGPNMKPFLAGCLVLFSLHFHTRGFKMNTAICDNCGRACTEDEHLGTPYGHYCPACYQQYNAYAESPDFPVMDPMGGVHGSAYTDHNYGQDHSEDVYPDYDQHYGLD
jgi:hypothetical protein